MTVASDGLPAVSAVIPSLGRRPEVLGLTIERLTAEACVAQVLVVAGAGAPRPPLDARRGVVSVVEATGAGPNSSRQAGLDAAGGEVVLFLDDDVLPDPGLAAGHASHHARAEDLVVVGYMPVVCEAVGRYGTATAELYALEYERRVKRYEAEPDSILSNLWGGNISLRRIDALRVGVRNAAYPGRRHEDQDFGLRCASAGLHGLFDRDLRAAHHYSRSRRAFLEDAWSQGYERTMLRRNEPGSEWFLRGTGDAVTGRGGRTADRALRRAELASLRAARRMQLWRGSRRARRDADGLEEHAWQRR